MINKLKPKSEFSRNVLTLMTGTTIAQAIPIAISPILTRIYTPEDFGLFALFIAITSIFGSIANGRYELAIMLPKKDEDAINIFALGFIITSSVSLLLLLLVMLFHDYFVMLLNNDEIGFWLYFIPIAVFFIGLFNILNYFNTRRKNYKDIANATIIKSIVLAIVQLSIGFMKQGASGLISGQILSQMFANLRLLKNILKDKVLISKIKMIALAKRYKDFPKFSMWAILANNLSIHFINILMSIFYSVSTLGFYSLVQKILSMPMILIGGSISQVFFEKASHEKKIGNNLNDIFIQALKKLLFISIPLFLILFFMVEDLFAFVFAEEWRVAGVYAQIVIPLFLSRFIVSAFTMIPIIYTELKVDLFFQVGMLLLSFIIIYLSYVGNLDFITYLMFYSLIISVYYLVYLGYLYNRFIKLGELK